MVHVLNPWQLEQQKHKGLNIPEKIRLQWPGALWMLTLGRQVLRSSSLKVNQHSQAGKNSPFLPDGSRASREKQHVHLHNLPAEEVRWGMKWRYNNEKAPRRLLIRFKLEPSKHCDYNCSSKLNIMHISFNTHLSVLIQFTAIVPLIPRQTKGKEDLSVWCGRHQCVCTRIPKWFTA